jgi:hypothetical protein
MKKNDTSNLKSIKILFYTYAPRAFRATLIGHLYEISQVCSVVLLSEKMDQETENILKDGTLFPKLEKIIPANQFIGKEINLFSKNRQLYNLAKKTTTLYKPDIVISASDSGSLFELYLMRFAKKINAFNLTIQPSNIAEVATSEKRVDVINSYLRFPLWLPMRLRIFATKCRKYFGHFFYYWFLPLIVGERPFFGKSSYILRKGSSGMRDASAHIVFSKRDYNIHVASGVLPEKIYILSHPIQRRIKIFFNGIFFKNTKEANAITIILASEEGIGLKKDFSLITLKDRKKIWFKTVKHIYDIFPDRLIYIKPHPDTKNSDMADLRRKFESISENIKFANKQEFSEEYIAKAGLIIGLPMSVSTTLYTAALRYPEKPIISLDFYHELIGDYYQNFQGIEYVDDEQKFIKLLEQIRAGQYKKNLADKKELGEREYPDLISLINHLLSLKNSSYEKK